MSATTFASRPLPGALARAVRARLAAEHAVSPFSPVAVRDAARRAARAAGELGLSFTMYRGGLDLAGVEVDHVWLATASDAAACGSVVDVAFPLFDDDFVGTLRRFVAGLAEPGDLSAAAARSPVSSRVVGELPSAIRYRGAPFWSGRVRSAAATRHGAEQGSL